MNLTGILEAYGLDIPGERIKPFGSGLINHTWKVDAGAEAYILQRINTDIFKAPEAIAANINAVGLHLKTNGPDYLFVQPLKTLEGATFQTNAADGHFRVFPFLKGSRTIDVVTDPSQAYEAARQFALFTRSLEGIDIRRLQITLPDFHNLSLRLQQFMEALQHGRPERIQEAAPLITFLLAHQSIVEQYESACSNPAFHLRVTHHDTKISNVLFDEKGKGLCVIDLDTMMPGYFISDVGDMMRTYLSPVSEEERDFSKIEIRRAYFEAIVEGYLSEMGDALTSAERQSFVYAGKFMLYMQALRFLTDYLNDDVYYRAAYPDQNLVRAGNQAAHLQKLMEQEEDFVQYLSRL